MAVELATAYVSLTASAKGIGTSVAKELGDELAGPLDKAGNDAGDKASRGFVSKFSSGLGGLKTAGIAAAGLFAAGFAAVIGGGVLLEGIGAQFDDAFDSLRIGTGKTGEDLAALEESFRTVFRNVPTDMGSASTAIGELNRRLGLTGKPLEDLSTEFLNLSRITGTDLGGNVEAVSGLFNQFGVDAAFQSARLTQLFRVSQQTGIGVADLATQMTDAGVALSEVGLNFEEQAGLLGLLAKQGLAAGDVLPAVSRALATAAKEGKPAEQVFKDTFAAIAFAPDDVKAAGLALDVFGAKAGPKFAALIRAGKLSYEDFAKTISGSGDSINQAAADTDDWREKLTLLKNRALLALEPIAAKVFDGITDAVEKATPLFDKLQEGVQRFAAVFSGGELSGEGGVIGFMERLAVISREVVDVVKRNWPQIQLVITDVLTTVQGVIQGFVDVVTTLWDQFGGKIMTAVRSIWGSMAPIIEGALNVIKGIITTVTALIHGDWSRVWEGIKQIFSGVVQGLIGLAQNLVARIRFVLSVLGEILGSIFRAAWDAAKKKTSEGIEGVLGFFRSLPGKILGFAGAVLGAGRSIGEAILTGIGRGLSAAAGFAADIGGAVARAAKTAVNFVIDRVNSALEFRIPLPFGKSFTVNPPNIPHVHTGGVIPGAPGSEALRILQAGERVFTDEQSRALQRIAAGALPAQAPVVITGNTFVGTGPEVTRLLSAKITEGRRAGVKFLGA